MEGDRLYGLPLERFVPERAALAKSLRAERRREEAGEVAKLRKPSVAAWAVNQLVRTQGRAIAELFDAGDGLVQAHAAIVSGAGDARSLREAAARERTAVEALVGAARGLLTDDGHELSPSIIDRVADTLHAAALDEDARVQVREGRLERELRHVGLGAAGFAGGTAPPLPPAPPRSPKRQQRRSRDVAAARKAARAEEADARRAAEKAERAARDAARVRERAAELVRSREAALGEAQAALAEAESRLADAQARAREAAEVHARAGDELRRVAGA